MVSSAARGSPPSAELGNRNMQSAYLPRAESKKETSKANEMNRERGRKRATSSAGVKTKLHRMYAVRIVYVGDVFLFCFRRDSWSRRREHAGTRVQQALCLERAGPRQHCCATAAFQSASESLLRSCRPRIYKSLAVALEHWPSKRIQKPAYVQLELPPSLTPPLSWPPTLRGFRFQTNGNHKQKPLKNALVHIDIQPATHSAQTAAMSLGLVTLPLKYTTRDWYLGWRQRTLISSLGGLGAMMTTHTDTLLAF